MSGREALLIEIGCEEIPARMIRAAASDLERRIVGVLDAAGLAHGESRAWGGSRRLAVRVAEVEPRQADRDELLLGPPAAVAFDDAGAPTKAALGFARKQGVEPSELARHSTDRGDYVGLRRRVEGADLGKVLAEALPEQVGAMRFPKTMRWADGVHRWVRPVHWVVALLGEAELPLELFGVRASRRSTGHRFLGDGAAEIGSAAAYESSLRTAMVLVDPAERRERIVARLDAAAAELEPGARPVDDAGLLEEVVDLVEWPGVVGGRFDESFLELPSEILVTTLRHHQKCFSVAREDGRLLPAFLAVANTDRDRAGHVRRGNEWVVGGRLDDARFFWDDDRSRPLAELAPRLATVVFHAKVGSFADKAERTAVLAHALGAGAGLAEEVCDAAVEAAALAKVDLLTGTVGEFPELQGQVGGLLLRAEGRDERIAGAVYDHYRPVGPDDGLPDTDAGCLLAAADKLDSIAALIAAGEVPTSSRDPLGLRRATAGLFRIVLDRRWPTDLPELVRIAGGGDALDRFLAERLTNFFRDRGATANEVAAVLAGGGDRPLHDVSARLGAIAAVRDREDFAHLVELTKRVDTILQRNEAMLDGSDPVALPTTPEAAGRLVTLLDELSPRIAESAAEGEYSTVIESLARFIEPVDRFFGDVLVIDGDDLPGTRSRCRLLFELRAIVIRDFDIRELAGEARRGR